MCRELLYKNKIRIVSIKLLCKIVDVPRVNLEPYKLLKFWNQNLYKIYKIATNEDTNTWFILRSMIHYSMGTPLPKTKIRLTNYRYYTPKYPSQVLTTPIILLKKILFSDYFQNKMTPLMRSKKVSYTFFVKSQHP